MNKRLLTKYRMWLAEPESLEQLKEKNVHYQVFAPSLTKCWEKANKIIIRPKDVYVSTISQKVKASFLSTTPRELGETRDHKYRLYVQVIPR